MLQIGRELLLLGYGVVDKVDMARESIDSLKLPKIKASTVDLLCLAGSLLNDNSTPFVLLRLWIPCVAYSLAAHPKN